MGMGLTFDEYVKLKPPRVQTVQRFSAPVGGRSGGYCGRCQLSGNTGDAIQKRYLTAATFSPLGLLFPIVMLLTRKQVCVAVQCSEESFRKCRSIFMKTIFLLLGWLLLGGPLALAGMIVLGPKMPILSSVIGLGWFACLPVLILWMVRYRRRALDALVSDSLNSRLCDKLKGRRWGLTTTLTIGKKAPRRLTVVPASSL